MKKLTENISKNDPSQAFVFLKDKSTIDAWMMYIVPKIGVYFKTTLGFPLELFHEMFQQESKLEQLMFCINQVRKNHYYDQ